MYPRLGDLVIGKQIWRYDLGRLEQEGVQSILPPQQGSSQLANRAKAFEYIGLTQKWWGAIEVGLNRCRRQTEVLFSKYEWKRPDANTDLIHNDDGTVLAHSAALGRIVNLPQNFHQPIAVGDTVLKNRMIREALAQKGYFAVEMESYGVLQARDDKLKVLSIRGIADYSDGYKNKSWQPYAAMVAAAYLSEFLQAFKL